MADAALPTKKQKTDYFERLPNESLCHVLSFLPTKEAVATCTLSTRWRHLFKCLTSLDFNDSLISKHHSCEQILSCIWSSFFDRVMESLEVKRLDKFRINFHSSTLPPSVVQLWISRVLTCGLQDLDLSIRDDLPDCILVLPPSIFNSNSLVVLKLCGLVFVIIPPSVHLPSLKKLLLVSLMVRNTEPVNTLISGCPILEDLVINKCSWGLGLEEINISSVTLKRFNLGYSSLGCKHETLVLDTPSLLELCLTGNPMYEYSMNNLQSLCTAEVNLIGFPSALPDVRKYKKEMVGLVNSISHAKMLNLSLYNFWPHGDFPNSLPMFDNATKFVVCGTENDGIGRRTLDTLLNKLPKVEELVILHAWTRTIYRKEEHEELKSSSDQVVPSCLLSHLKTVKFGELHNRRSVSDVGEMVKYFLTNARVLEKLIIYAAAAEEEEEEEEEEKKEEKEEDMDARAEVLTFPRCSGTCQSFVLITCKMLLGGFSNCIDLNDQASKRMLKLVSRW
ncbi:hypothetical protein ACFE04_019114 [Oxalis oulophora]